ncbi:hypothetical protein LX32DRAFT_687753 [Colletotrichum zoysiae]|uniref:Uncharacterized protein n=1 Tax=Colletotrichum zoysiae TaxID=1216348 RepID=A0AAD9H328_9PEZI|nr:hypothetical protein LX32DRAFT_687753 [Colletotrichum zoysiae]
MESMAITGCSVQKNMTWRSELTYLEARQEAWKRARERTTVEDLEALIAHLVILGETVDIIFLHSEAVHGRTRDEWQKAWSSVLDDGLYAWVDPDPKLLINASKVTGVQQGHRLESHDDVPEEIRAQLYA